jgi:solute carrier family 25 carnitine/acylcarnitine transporter 20/29
MSAGTDPAAIDAVELLQRRLMECECMRAMYGEDAGGDAGSSFEVCNPDVASALTAVVDAWEASGTAAAAALSMDALPLLRVSLTIAVPSSDDGGPSAARGSVTMNASLPNEYPSREPPSLELSATRLSRTAIADILNKLELYAAARTVEQATRGCDGHECLSELAQELSDLSARAADEDETRRAAAANDRDGDGDEATAEGPSHAVVRIDHMNDSKGYTKTLQKWSQQLGVDVRMFYERSPKAASGAETGALDKVGPPTGGRVEGVYVVLGGDGESIQSFLTRLRTEFVDVDAKGAKCKERKSTVMCRRAAGTVKPGEEPVPEFNGFECERYSGAEELEEVLARFNLLHVGAGTQRFQPTG